MASYDYRTTIVRLVYDVVQFSYDLDSHQAILVNYYIIVRLSFDCRTLPMGRKPIASSVITKLKLQYRSRVGENVINLRCHPSHDVAARCD